MKFGYCLSGGGMRGLAHLGIMKALEESGIKPSIISGTSAGALMGAFHAAGFTPDEIFEVAIRAKFLTRTYLQWRKQGLFSMEYFGKLFKLFFPKDSFEALKVPLIVAATDIIKGEISYYESGELIKVLMASSCVPMVFQPVEMKNSVFMDGGILDNFPITPLDGRCDKIIGSYVNDMDISAKNLSMIKVIDRTFNLAVNDNIGSKKEKCVLFISPPDMMQFGIMETKKAREIFEYGYKYAKSVLTSDVMHTLLA